MNKQISKYNNIILEALENIQNIVNDTNYTSYELSINNNKYEKLFNSFLNTYKNIFKKITESSKIIKLKNKKYVKYKNMNIQKLDDLLLDINDLYNNVENNTIIIENKYINNINYIDDKYDYKLFGNEFIDDVDNLDIINDFDFDIKSDTKLSCNYINVPEYKMVNIGLNNYYELPYYEYINNDIPLNLLVYINNISSVVIKVGNKKKFRYINAKISRVPDNINETKDKNNKRSILCNNNLIEYNKKCINGKKCTYYHDPIIGYPDIAHTDRQFPYNPIIYNCPNFKDGLYIKDNVKKIKWEDGLNLYQTSFSYILLGLIHSLE